MKLRTVAALVIGLAAFGTVSAETPTLRVNIPFSFEVNGKALPAGEYTVRQPNSSGAMMIQDTDHNIGDIALASPVTAQSDHPGTARLIFHRHGNEYFLSEVWMGTSEGSHIPLTRREQNLIAETSSPSETVIVALR